MHRLGRNQGGRAMLRAHRRANYRNSFCETGIVTQESIGISQPRDQRVKIETETGGNASEIFKIAKVARMETIEDLEFIVIKDDPVVSCRLRLTLHRASG